MSDGGPAPQPAGDDCTAHGAAHSMAHGTAKDPRPRRPWQIKIPVWVGGLYWCGSVGMAVRGDSPPYGSLILWTVVVMVFLGSVWGGGPRATPRLAALFLVIGLGLAGLLGLLDFSFRADRSVGGAAVSLFTDQWPMALLAAVLIAGGLLLRHRAVREYVAAVERARRREKQARTARAEQAARAERAVRTARAEQAVRAAEAARADGPPAD